MLLSETFLKNKGRETETEAGRHRQREKEKEKARESDFNMRTPAMLALGSLRQEALEFKVRLVHGERPYFRMVLRKESIKIFENSETLVLRIHATDLNAPMMLLCKTPYNHT